MLEASRTKLEMEMAALKKEHRYTRIHHHLKTTWEKLLILCSHDILILCCFFSSEATLYNLLCLSVSFLLTVGNRIEQPFYLLVNLSELWDYCRENGFYPATIKDI